VCINSDLFSGPTRGPSAAESEYCRAHFLSIFQTATETSLANTLDLPLQRWNRSAGCRSLIEVP